MFIPFAVTKIHSPHDFANLAFFSRILLILWDMSMNIKMIYRI